MEPSERRGLCRPALLFCLRRHEDREDRLRPEVGQDYLIHAYDPSQPNAQERFEPRPGDVIPDQRNCYAYEHL